VVTITSDAVGRSWAIEIATSPDLGDEAGERLVQHRPAPDDRAVLLGEEADRHQTHAVRLHRQHQVLHRHGGAVDPHHARDRVAVDVGVQYPDGRAAGHERQGEVHRDARLADAALARGDADHGRGAALLEGRGALLGAEAGAQAAPLLVAHDVHGHVDGVDPRQRGERLGDAPLDLGLQGAAGDGEADGHGDPPVADLDVAHHAEVDDRAVQLGVVHLAERRHGRVSGEPAHMNIRA
jgi:hypothetical protein